MNAIYVCGLRCGFRTNPLGIDEPSPRLSWELKAEGYCRLQTACRVLVSDREEALAEDRGDLWDSGKTTGAEPFSVLYGGKQLRFGMRCFWKVRVWDENDEPSPWSETAFWTVGPLCWEDWGAEWISCPGGEGRTSSPMFRKEFEVPGEVRRAMLYATSRGVYEARLNGEKADGRVLAPEWTDYTKLLQYQVYDVTELVRTGKNVLGAVLGDGWYAGELQNWPSERKIYGSGLAFLARLEITLDGGAVQVVTTDGSWESTAEGPIRFSGIYAGETFNARRELPGWDDPEAEEKAWRLPEPLYRGICRPNPETGCWRPVSADPHPGSAAIVAQSVEPIRIVRKLRPVSVRKLRSGVWLFDFGQCVCGWCSLRLDEQPGTAVTVRYNEILNDDGTLYDKNLRAGRMSECTRRQTDEYLCRGGGEVFEPHFTYHGFRYAEVAGVSGEMTAESAEACVIRTDLPAAGSFDCSNGLLSRVYAMIQQTFYGNLVGILTDCCSRDERLGWMGDHEALSGAEPYFLSAPAFLNKVIRDLRTGQLPNGSFTDFVPYPPSEKGPGYGLPGWCDAGVIIPWASYLAYGDKRQLELQYESVRRYLDFVKAHAPGGIWSPERYIGDWLGGDTISCPGYPKTGASMQRELFTTAFYAHDVDLASRMAKALGRDQEAVEYRSLFRQLKELFCRDFLTEDGQTKLYEDVPAESRPESLDLMIGDVRAETQSGYALALAFGLIPENLREKSAKRMNAMVDAYDGRFSTGFLGAAKLLTELCGNGHAETAYRLMASDRFPSPGYMLKQGATTLWERWDGFVHGRGYADSAMNAFDHIGFCCLGEWFWRCLVGLAPEEEAPGYRRFTVRPVPCGDLKWVRASYQSVAGRIGVEWRAEDAAFTLLLDVPAGTEAKVILPPGKEAVCVRAGADLTAEQVTPEWFCGRRTERQAETENGCAVYRLGSGRYGLFTRR